MDSDGRLMIIVLELKRHLLGAGKLQLLSASQGRGIRRRKQVTRLTWRRMEVRHVVEKHPHWGMQKKSKEAQSTRKSILSSGPIWRQRKKRRKGSGCRSFWVRTLWLLMGALLGTGFWKGKYWYLFKEWLPYLFLQHGLMGACFPLDAPLARWLTRPNWNVRSLPGAEMPFSWQDGLFF